MGEPSRTQRCGWPRRSPAQIEWAWERTSAEKIPGTNRVGLGADKGYDQADVVEELRRVQVTPHVAQKQRSAVDGRTTRHVGYQTSQRVRKRVEEVFGWMKTIGLLRKLRHRGLDQVGWMFTFTAAAYNLVRARNQKEAGNLTQQVFSTHYERAPQCL